MKRRASINVAPEVAALGAQTRPVFSRALLFLFCFLFTFNVSSAHATEDCSDCVEVGRWRLNIGMGAGIRSNPLHQGDDIPLILLPEISYYGQRFFLKNLEMGFTLFEDKRHQLNVLITPGYDQMYFNRWDPFNFTDGGGFTAGGFTGSPPGIAASYQVNISGNSTPDGAFPANPEGQPSGVYIPQATTVYINDQPISLDSTRQMLFGAEGNPITIQIEEDLINIRGVVAGDRVRLSGVQLHSNDFEGVGGASVEYGGPAGMADTVLIDLGEGDRYRVTAEASSVVAAQNKITADAVSSRKMAGLAGFEYSYSLRHASLHFQALSDFTGVHHGHEMRAAVIFPWHIGEQKLAVTVGANYKSREILEYYYGVGPRDTDMPDLFFTPASSGLEKMVRFDWQCPLSEKWSLRAMVQYSRLPGSINNSPLLSDEEVGSIFFGGIYHF